MLRSAQVGAGVAAGSLVSPLPVPAFHGSEHRALAPPGLPRPPLTNADYWRFADWLAPYFDAVWVPEKNLYGSGNSGVGRIYHNSLLLTTHAVAALSGHQGPCRNDERARALARRLCDSPPWSERDASPEGDPQFHNPGWVESMGTREAAMDKSIDPKVAEALMYAWRARDVLRLPRETVDLIADRVSRCARGPFFRFPNVRLNQINWNCELYAHTATITGDAELLVNDYRAQVVRFCDGITRAALPGGSPNLGPGYRFHYLPHRPPTHPFNIDSAEYASETVHFILYYEQALAAGMAPIAPEQENLLRAWAEHIVCAYWTHGGYLNWDTGYGFKRWHAGRTWALAQQGLLAIAASPRFHPRPELGGWAKHQFDRGLALYERLSQAAADGKGIAPSNLYDVNVAPLGPSIRELFAARMQANAVRAVALGLGGMQAPEPPPLYSFDGDIGRLAVTTKHYSTAVLPVSQRAFPYGGMELCRLYDGDQRVVSNVGGRPWASFGVLVRQRGKEIATSQRPKAVPPLRPPLRLLSSPHGRVDLAQQYPPRPYAGPFETLIAQGRTGVRRGGRRHDPPLLRGLDRDALGDRAPAPRTLHRRRAVPLVGPGGNGRGDPARRAPRDAGRAGPPPAQRLPARRRLLLHRGRGHRLRRGADRQEAARHGAHPATQGAVLGAATRADPGGAARPGQALQAAGARGAYRSGARARPTLPRSRAGSAAGARGERYGGSAQA